MIVRLQATIDLGDEGDRWDSVCETLRECQVLADRVLPWGEVLSVVAHEIHGRQTVLICSGTGDEWSRSKGQQPAVVVGR